MTWLKFLHLAALILWLAGLLYLPAMLWAHHSVRDQQDFARIRMASRFVYMGLVSPAALIAVSAGTALLFVGDALYGWMFLKLAFVGLLVFAHMQYGHVLAHLADQEARAPTLRVKAIALAVLVATAAILWLVLAKPELPVSLFPQAMTEPGLLRPPESPGPSSAPAPAPPPRS